MLKENYNYANAIECEKEKLLYACKEIDRLIYLFIQQIALLEKFEGLFLDMEISEQRKRIEENIQLLKRCLNSMEICRDCYDAMMNEIKASLRIGCDMPRDF